MTATKKWWKPGTQTHDRESPQDFMQKFNQWQRDTGQAEKKVQLTPKAYAILRKSQKERDENKDN